MKSNVKLFSLSWLIAILALVAAGAGVLWQGGEHTTFTTMRGQTVEMWGGGLYKFDSVASASQAIAQDVVTLFLGIPLLVLAIALTARGSLRGKLLLTGTLGYFLYSYTAMAMLISYNELFLVYVAIFSLSLFAFVMCVASIKVNELPNYFTDKFPRKSIAAFMLFLGSMLGLLWLGRIGPSMISGTAPASLETATTLVIQVLDLGVIVPVAILAGVMLLKKQAIGYLLSTVVLIKGLTLGAATSAMVVGQIMAGVEVSAAEGLIFPLFTILDIVLTVRLLLSVKDTQSMLAEWSKDGAQPLHDRQVTDDTTIDYLLSPRHR